MSHQIIAVGSVDGVLTTAAYLRYLGEVKANEVDVQFTQAFTVQQVTIIPGATLTFIDLAVNNQDEGYTKTFVLECLAKECSIDAIVDEHDAAAWQRVLPPAVWDSLAIKPVSQKMGDIKSSGALLLSCIGSVSDDDWLAKLCNAANAADQGIFQGVNRVVNKAIKAKIADNDRRVYLARHFAFKEEPNSIIKEWVAQYEEVEANMAAVMATAEDHGSWIHVDTRGKKVDMTTLAMDLYRQFPSAIVVVAKGQAFDKSRGGVVSCYSFMASTNAPGDFDLTEIIKNVPAFGFAKKLNVLDKHYSQALESLKVALA